MKIKSILSGILVIFAVVSACNRANDKETVADTSASQVDTVSTDTVAVIEEAVPQNPEEVLTLEVVSKNLVHVPESSFYEGNWKVKVTNNGKSDVAGDSYEIVYTEVVEDDFEDVSMSRSIKGETIAAGESTEFLLKASEFCQTFKNPKIKAVK